MKETVDNLITMYEDGKLHTEQSTQRSFIYNTIKVEREDGELTKAGDVIRSILQEGIQLPALYFWNIQDDDAELHYADDEYNIHDGKQRFLSIYKFVKGEVVTRLQDPVTGITRETTFDGLTAAQQSTLLDYELDIVVRTGTQAEEERSFYLINSTGEILTAYESLRGAYHGEYFNTFEAYITKLSKIMTRIMPINRGEQAFWLMLLATDRFDGSKDDKNKEKLVNKLRDKLSDIRNNTFDQKTNNFDKKVELYNELSVLLNKNNNDKTPIKVCRIVKYVVDRHYDPKVVLAYYKKILASINDVASWKFGTHKTALDRLCLRNIECDGLRFFTKADKTELVKTSGWTCCTCGKTLSNFEEVTIDHITPWSEGGRTNLANGRIMCNSCNASKGATYDEEGIY